MPRARVLVIGGGPAGSVAALALDKLGHEVELYEREVLPRYRIGESLLPGTLSIFKRLGLEDMIASAGFVHKPSATFVWGQDQPPFTFSFSAPRVADYTYGHSLQAHREELDTMLLAEARARGIRVFEGAPVRDVDLSSPGGVEIAVGDRDGDGDGTRRVRGDFLVDASGAVSVLARKLQLRRFDEFYRSLALWSYFHCADPFRGDLRGTTFSIFFEDGWVWMIPLKGDVYSVGIVVDQSRSGEIQEQGIEAFYTQTLPRCRQAMEILGDAERAGPVRATRDWSYDTTTFSAGRFFLAGDAACFTDPLFSQGIHLAAQSAVSAASGIDRMVAHPEEADAIHRWYARSYGGTYEHYHEFLASFYTYASLSQPESVFWTRRRIQAGSDPRVARRGWAERLTAGPGNGWSVDAFCDRAATMIAVGEHQRRELSSEFSEAELQPARTRWITRLTAQLNSITRFRWNGEEVVLHPYYKVSPRSFQLEPRLVLGNETGRMMTKYAVEPPLAEAFRGILRGDVSYRKLIRSLVALGAKETGSQIVLRLFEAGLLAGFDCHGEQVRIQDRLHFEGVGVDYEV